LVFPVHNDAAGQAGLTGIPVRKKLSIAAIAPAWHAQHRCAIFGHS
jgi:hypothetical protein